MAKPGIRDLISLVPGQGGICVGFLADGGPQNPTNAGKLLYSFGLAVDAVIEKMWQGIAARMPGYNLTPTVLPYIGLDRGIVRGITETDAQYEGRLQTWYDVWRIAGSARAVLTETLGYLLSATPMVRSVDENGNWNTYIPGDNPTKFGPSRYLNSVWNWDNDYDPHVTVPMFWRWWLLLYAGTTLVGNVSAATNTIPIQLTVTAHGLSTGATVFSVGVNGNTAANGAWTVTKIDANNFTLNGSDGNGTYAGGGTVYGTSPGALGSWCKPSGSLGDGRTLGSGGSLGINQPAGFAQTLQGIVRTFQKDGAWCRWIMVNFDPAIGNPFGSSDGTHNPNGGWAKWSKIVNGQYVPARNPNARYMDGAF